MQDLHIRFGKCKLCLIQNVEVFHADIVFFIEETLLLNTGHVKKVKLRKCILKTNDFLELLVIAYEHVVTDVVRETELIRRDQNKFDVRITDQCLDQGVNSTAEFQVAAKADREIVKASLFGADRHQIGQRLGRMLMAAVSGIDDRDR